MMSTRSKELLTWLVLLLFFIVFIYITFFDSYLRIRGEVRQHMIVEGWSEEKELRAICEEFRLMPENRKFLLRLETEEIVKVIKERRICDEVFK